MEMEKGSALVSDGFAQYMKQKWIAACYDPIKSVPERWQEKFQSEHLLFSLEM